MLKFHQHPFLLEVEVKQASMFFDLRVGEAVSVMKEECKRRVSEEIRAHLINQYCIEKIIFKEG